MSYDEFRRCIDNKSSGAVRVSLGLASNYADVAAFLDFARDVPHVGRDERTDSIMPVP